MRSFLRAWPGSPPVGAVLTSASYEGQDAVGHVCEVDETSGYPAVRCVRACSGHQRLSVEDAYGVRRGRFAAPGEHVEKESEVVRARTESAASRGVRPDVKAPGSESSEKPAVIAFHLAADSGSGHGDAHSWSSRPVAFERSGTKQPLGAAVYASGDGPAVAVGCEVLDRVNGRVVINRVGQ